MKSKKIRKIFLKEFNNMPNPIFTHPFMYFKHKNYLCEVASTGDSLSVAAHKVHLYDVMSLARAVCLPLFYPDGLWITVLEVTPSGIKRREDLCGHISAKKDINTFINTKLN